MKMHRSAASSVVALLMFSPLAFAGQWTVWTERAAANELVVVASFAGDGQSDETQLDLRVDAPFKVRKVETLVPGSVCIAPKERGFLRSVPPSGAGTALPSSDSATCVFTLELESVALNRKSMDNLLRVEFVECVSSKTGSQSCDTKVQSLGPIGHDPRRGPVHD